MKAPELLSAEELKNVHVLGAELRELWEAQTTDHRDRKRLLRCLIEEVQLRTEEQHYGMRIVWKGGATTEREIVRGPEGWAPRAQEDTMELVHTLAAEFDDAQIARILNRQGRRSGHGIPFTTTRSRPPPCDRCAANIGSQRARSKSPPIRGTVRSTPRTPQQLIIARELLK